MASLYDPLHNAGANPGTSGAEVSDLHPEQAYDTDLRRVAQDERVSTKSINKDQDRVGKFMRASRAAGAYRQRSDIAEPTLKGKTPKSSLSVAGVELPSLGDSGGRTGSTAYSRKPDSQFGKDF